MPGGAGLTPGGIIGRGGNPVIEGGIRGGCPCIGMGGLMGSPLGPASPGGAIPMGGTTCIARPIGYTRAYAAAPELPSPTRLAD